MKTKELIASELSGSEPILNSNQFGKFVSRNYSLSTFKRSKNEWVQSLDKEKKKRDLFSDILDDKKFAKKAKVEVEDSGVEKEQKSPEKKKKIKAKSYLDDL